MSEKPDGQGDGPDEDSPAAFGRLEAYCEKRIDVLHGQLQAALTANNLGRDYDDLLNELEAQELFLPAVRERDLAGLRVIAESSGALEDLSGGSREGEEALVTDIQAVLMAQEDRRDS